MIGFTRLPPATPAEGRTIPYPLRRYTFWAGNRMLCQGGGGSDGSMRVAPLCLSVADATTTRAIFSPV